MPLVYENAAGGPGVWNNPVGIGGPGVRALPCVVDPRDPRRPAGFGPVSGAWMPRRGFLGETESTALSEPIFEAGPSFDWRYFQAAPADQLLDGIRGDEWIVLDGMHPTHARVQSRLPQARAAAILRGEGQSERSIELRADTLVIDADDLLVSIVWRGRFAVGSPDVLATARVFAGVSLPGHPIEWPARATKPVMLTGPAARGSALETQDVNLAALLGGVTPFDADRKSALPSPLAASPSPAAATETGVIDLDKVFQRPVPFLAADAEHPSDAAAPAPRGQRPTTMSTGTTDVNLAEILKGAALFGKAPGSVPAASVPIAPVPVAPVPTSAPNVSLPVAPVPIASLPVAPAPIASLPVAPASGSDMRAVVLERLREKRRLDKLNLRGADLHDIDFQGASLKGVDLEGTILRGANLSFVDLTAARLSGADLTKADLTSANLLRAVGENANFAAARMEAADMRQAQLSSAIFDDADMRDVSATRADLSGARFFRADLSSANLRAAKLCGADLTQAKTDGADLRDAEIMDLRVDPVAARLLKLRLPRST